MNIHNRFPSALFLGVFLMSGAALAQSTAPAPSGATKKELVARLLKLQQPGIEALARNMTLQPAAQMLQQASMVMKTRVAPEKRDTLAKEIDADYKKYADDAVPLVRDRAVKLAPQTMGKILDEKLSEDELQQVIAILESPAYAKYMQLGAEQQGALAEKLTVDLRPTIDPKLKALEASIGKRLNAAAGKPAAQEAPAK